MEAIDYSGYPVDLAHRMLTSSGYSVDIIECDIKNAGSPGEKRVVRQIQRDMQIELTVGAFKTTVDR